MEDRFPYIIQVLYITWIAKINDYYFNFYFNIIQILISQSPREWLIVSMVHNIFFCQQPSYVFFFFFGFFPWHRHTHKLREMCVEKNSTLLRRTKSAKGNNVSKKSFESIKNDWKHARKHLQTNKYSLWLGRT